VALDFGGAGFLGIDFIDANIRLSRPKIAGRRTGVTPRSDYGGGAAGITSSTPLFAT
jgi:hypothetical protein